MFGVDGVLSEEELDECLQVQLNKTNLFFRFTNVSSVLGTLHFRFCVFLLKNLKNIKHLAGWSNLKLRFHKVLYFIKQYTCTIHSNHTSIQITNIYFVLENLKELPSDYKEILKWSVRMQKAVFEWIYFNNVIFCSVCTERLKEYPNTTADDHKIFNDKNSFSKLTKRKQYALQLRLGQKTILQNVLNSLAIT